MLERADELDLYSSSTTVFTSKAYWRWMNTSTARQECATLSLYPGTLRPELQTDIAPMLLFAGCQNSTALNSLHYSIRSRVEVNFVDV